MNTSSKMASPRFIQILILLGLSIFVGSIAGLGAVAFRLLISNIQSIFFDDLGGVLAFLGRYYIIIIPAAGGLLVGPIVYFFAREAKGNGVPQVMKAIALEGGRIRPIVAVVKAIASSLCIGSGGSAGREGPIVQIGASLGSTVAQLLKLPEEQIKIVAACGAAGGIGATFNAPIAGALFALEIILQKVVTPIFAYILLGGISATYVASLFLGNKPMFALPSFHMSSPAEIGLYILLGILAAFAAVLLIRGIYGCEDLFNAMKMPEYLKPALGGIMVGLIGLYDFNLLGLGYGQIQNVLTGNLTIYFLISMMVLKVSATSLTLGSGGSGGIFSPSLFTGAMLGAALASLFRNILPLSSDVSGGYAVIAMAAVFAAATRAPFTAIVITFEMTRNYIIILPVMLAVAISTGLSMILSRDTIYTTKLRREGVDIEGM
jgi:CIC family chloride channel protein